jgi:hypothetical protein
LSRNIKTQRKRVDVGDPLAVCRYNLTKILNPDSDDGCVAELSINPASKRARAQFHAPGSVAAAEVR